MRNKENNGHIEQGKSVMTSLWLTRKIHAKNSFYSFAVVFFVKKVPKYGVFSGPNTGKYGPEKTSYLDTFQAVYGQY